MSKILVVDDDRTARKGLYFTINSFCDVVIAAESEKKADSCLNENEFDVIISDLRLPKEEDGINFIKKVKQMFPLTPILVITAYGSVSSAVESIKAGAYDYITKDFSKEEIMLKIKKILEIRKLWLANIRLSKEVTVLKNKSSYYLDKDIIVGESPKIKRVLDMVKRIGMDNESTVLIEGESGTGKELIARAIHHNSPGRNNEKFIVVDVASMPSALLESQLFGHEKGAFTGAKEKHVGYFEMADKGTVFLDEIGDLPIEMQVKLLRFIQEKTFIRVGSTKQLHSDVRIIAATNNTLSEMVEKNEFREDLYYRLSVINIHLPALRKRKEDIRKLIKHFTKKFEIIKGRELVFSDEVVEKLVNYNWPGNVRQLKNFIERFYVLSHQKNITLEDIDFENISNPQVSEELSEDIQALPLKEAKRILLEQFERNYISGKLEKNDGNITKTSSEIGISREALSNKIKNLGIKEKN